MDPTREIFELGDWRVDAAGNRLQRGAEVRPLRHKAMALLVLLASRPGETVGREEIIDTIWQGNRFVAPKAINTAVWTIRQALGDDPEAPRYLETIAKKGYRLIAPVRALAPPPQVMAPPIPAPARTTALPAPRWPLLAGLLVLAGLLAVWWLRPGDMAPAALPEARPLTHQPGYEYLGQLSPDGRLLAFAWWQGQGGGRLYLRPAAELDAAPQALSPEGLDVQGLSWSPDSSAIAYIAASADGQCQLRVYRLSERTQALARCSALFTPSVAWSPDGRSIAFSAEAEGVGGLFLVAPDGSGLRRLSSAPPAAMPDHQPSWSPDGRRLVFARQDPADGSRDFYEAGLDGQVQRLSQLRLYPLHGLTHAENGRDLIFSTTRQDSRVLMRWQRETGQALPLGLEGSAPLRSAGGPLVYALMRSHIGIARLDWGAGAQPQRLPGAVVNDRAPTADPAGGGLFFVSARSGRPELWRSEPRGDQARALTQLDLQPAAPAASPDGRQLAFLGNCGPGKRYGLCLLDLASGQLRPLAADAAQYGRPSWHPSGREVWVASDRGGRWQLWRFDLSGSPGATPLDTERPPGPALQWANDGSALLYQARASQELRRRPLAGGREQPMAAAVPEGEALLDWRLGPQGLVLLTRGSQAEYFRRLDLAGERPAQLLSSHALGSFPERASFALGADGSAWVELAHTAVADLMQAR
ncbi:winged helix-turn-helix domain-containing protein [Paucibacter sp. O1-1]|nr:winged helix-turn-helix domain-containing protein [Paucibacter sp. O1-1]MDA3827290.1 winged helix-turn-helix domain-containing protein [Paucibacter sp. O1-1]